MLKYIAPGPSMDGTPKDEIAEGYYFSADAGIFTRLTYFFLALFTVVLSVVSILAPLITPACPTEKGVTTKHPNPDYIVDDCRFVRYAILCGLSKFEADSCVRILVSIFCGSVIGFERRRPDRPAGVRTMALVCLGSCVFTIDSMWAFIDGPMAWDASRVAAAIPSGVGFLGAATIWKGTASKQDGGEPTAPEVHGLTTATSVWLSAAIGILCGGALYAPALFTTAASVVYLRFAPRMPKPKDGNGNSHHGASSPVAPSLEGLAAGVLSQSLREPLVQAEHRSAASGATPGESPIKGDYSSGSFSNKGSPRRTDRSSKGSAGLHL
jgi:hypothetical protein